MSVIKKAIILLQHQTPFEYAIISDITNTMHALYNFTIFLIYEGCFFYICEITHIDTFMIIKV